MTKNELPKTQAAALAKLIEMGGSAFEIDFTAAGGSYMGMDGLTRKGLVKVTRVEGHTDSRVCNGEPYTARFYAVA